MSWLPPWIALLPACDLVVVGVDSSTPAPDRHVGLEAGEGRPDVPASLLGLARGAPTRALPSASGAADRVCRRRTSRIVMGVVGWACCRRSGCCVTHVMRTR